MLVWKGKGGITLQTLVVLGEVPCVLLNAKGYDFDLYYSISKYLIIEMYYIFQTLYTFYIKWYFITII